MDATVVVVGVESVGPGTVAIELDSPTNFDADPGQFVKLSGTVGGEEYARFYTLSSPDVEDTFEVTVGVDTEESGPFSRYLAECSPGEELDVAGPFGSASYEGEPYAVVLAGGPGIGPAVAIAERALQDGHETAIVYQYAGDGPAHESRLDALASRGASIHYTDGAIEDAVADAVTGADGEQVFVYGFAAFLDAATDALVGAGTAPDAAKIENFG